MYICVCRHDINLAATFFCVLGEETTEESFYRTHPFNCNAPQRKKICFLLYMGIAISPKL